MERILVTLSYNNTPVTHWCNAPWNPDDPKAMAADLKHELSLVISDLCRDLVRQDEIASEIAASRINGLWRLW
jgi:hypothetical protein